MSVKERLGKGKTALVEWVKQRHQYALSKAEEHKQKREEING